jgi:hypothetical protein
MMNEAASVVDDLIKIYSESGDDAKVAEYQKKKELLGGITAGMGKGVTHGAIARPPALGVDSLQGGTLDQGPVRRSSG